MKENTDLSLALGFFDGVHLGHQAVIKGAVEYGNAAVVTFKDHPCCHIWGVCPKYILTREERKRRIKSLGADEIYELDFAEVAHMSAAEYLDFLRKEFNPAAIFTGYNHTFGKDKTGSPEFLRSHFENYFEVASVKFNNTVISSTEIRTALTNGEIEKANAMLGYSFAISGEVVEGQKLGRQLGFPTANLVYPPELIELPYGAYSVKVGDNKGVANFGIKPTINHRPSTINLEVHILDFERDIYGQTINVEFLKMLRPEKKFSSLEELKSQIAEDIKEI
jgi:riboflavin kinase/FMN adenylyltransferase